MGEKRVAIALLNIIPLGLGTTSIGRYVGEAVRALNRVEGVRYEVTSMGTILEAESLDKILEATKVAYNTVLGLGVQRVDMTLNVDHRLDKPRTKEDKVKSIERYVAEGQPR